MSIRILILLLLIMQPVAAEELRLLTGRAEQTAVGLTIYNNMSLIREVRAVDLPVGVIELEFQDVARTIDPSSVFVQSDDANLRVLEQSYRYDLLNKQTLLERFLGRKLKYSRTVREGMRFEKVLREGTLLSINPEVVQFGDEIEIEPEGIISLAYLPDDLKTTPTLHWLLENNATGTKDIEVSYVADGIGWQADYNLTVSPDDTMATLIGWVTIRNESGARFEEADIKLVAGDVNREQAREPMPVMRREMAMMADAGAAMPTREGLSDYQLYRLPRPVNLDVNTVKQVKLLRLEDLAVDKRYTLDSQVQTYQVPDAMPHPVSVTLALDNHGDVPLPAGKYRAYKEDSDGDLQFLGEDRLGHKPRKEALELEVGRAFDVRATRKQTVFRRVGDRTMELGYEIVVSNQARRSVDVEVVERMQGDWQILTQSQRGERRDAARQVYVLSVGAGDKARLDYSVRIRF